MVVVVGIVWTTVVVVVGIVGIVVVWITSGGVGYVSPTLPLRTKLFSPAPPTTERKTTLSVRSMSLGGELGTTVG